MRFLLGFCLLGICYQLRNLIRGNTDIEKGIIEEKVEKDLG